MTLEDPDQTPAITPPRKAGSSERRERTRQAIVATAIRLIGQHGIDGTSVLEVTEAMGISNGAFYYHFRNKDHLLEDVGHVIVSRLVERIECVQRSDPALQVARGPIIVMRFFRDHPELRDIMLRVIDDIEGNHESLHLNLRDHVQRGDKIGRFKAYDLDTAVAFGRALVASALRRFNASSDPEQLAIQTSVQTLAMLGVPAWEAHTLVEQEVKTLTIAEGTPVLPQPPAQVRKSRRARQALD